MLKKLLPFIFCLMACGGTSTIAPPNVPPTPVIDKRADLPAGYIEVKGSGYSFGLPADFTALLSPNEYKLLFASGDKLLTVGFTYENNSAGTMPEYLRSIILPRLAAAKFRIQEARHNSNTDMYAVVSYLPDTNNVSNDTVRLDFFKQSQQTVYQLTCFGAQKAFSDKGATCFEIAQTLQLSVPVKPLQ